MIDNYVCSVLLNENDLFRKNNSCPILTFGPPQKRASHLNLEEITHPFTSIDNEDAVPWIPLPFIINNLNQIISLSLEIQGSNKTMPYRSIFYSVLGILLVIAADAAMVERVLLVQVYAGSKRTLQTLDEIERVWNDTQQQLGRCSGGAVNMSMDLILVHIQDSTYDPNTVRNAARSKLCELYSLPETCNPGREQGYRHVLYIVPRDLIGAHTTEAYGFSGGIEAVFFDRPSGPSFRPLIVMHEIGHHWSLGHAQTRLAIGANENAEYGDDTSVMGNPPGDHLCFNGYVMATLGWMPDKILSVTSGESMVATLSGIANELSSHHYQVVHHGNIFLTYNLKKGVNMDQTEHIDKVLVVTTVQHTLYPIDNTMLIAALDVGEAFITDDFSVFVCARVEEDVLLSLNIPCESKEADAMVVEPGSTTTPIIVTSSPTPSPSRNPTHSPSASPSLSPTVSPTKSTDFPTPAPSTSTPTTSPTHPEIPTEAPSGGRIRSSQPSGGSTISSVGHSEISLTTESLEAEQENETIVFDSSASQRILRGLFFAVLSFVHFVA